MQEIPVIQNEGFFEPLQEIAKAITVIGNMDEDGDFSEEWWQIDFANGDTTWGKPEHGDGEFFTTIHHREVEIAGEGINTPGRYTQTAIITRTDGEAAPIKAIIITGKMVELYNYEDTYVDFDDYDESEEDDE